MNIEPVLLLIQSGPSPIAGMKEEDLCELLRFERKQLRARMSNLKNDKFLVVRLKMETGPDGKAAKVNYYFINYKTFVNVVKYKLDLMRKRMETEERDATSRASFKCPNCNKSFTDLEADQLFDFTTGEFRCTFCGGAVEEDGSAMPKKDSRLLLAKFNEQLQPLYDLLRDVENIKLAPECLEPEPVDIETIRGQLKPQHKGPGGGEVWSGEASRSSGFAVEEARVNVSISDTNEDTNQALRKDRPVWMTESTVVSTEYDAQNSNEDSSSLLDKPDGTASSTVPGAGNSGTSAATGASSTVQMTQGPNSRRGREGEDIMSVLLAHEKKTAGETAVRGLTSSKPNYDSDSSDEEDKMKVPAPVDLREYYWQRLCAIVDHPETSLCLFPLPPATVDDEIMDSDSDEESVTVFVEGKAYPIDEINDGLVAKMTPQEKETYIQVYQENFSHMYE